MVLRHKELQTVADLIKIDEYCKHVGLRPDSTNKN